VLDDVFGASNFVAIVPVVKTAGLGAIGLATVCDFLLWYGRSKASLKYRQLYLRREVGDEAQLICLGRAHYVNGGGLTQMSVRIPRSARRCSRLPSDLTSVHIERTRRFRTDTKDERSTRARTSAGRRRRKALMR